MKILGTGLNGLVGSRIVEFLKNTYEFENISRATGVDITNKDQVFAAVSDSSASILLHLAAKTDVDGCEREKKLGENSQAWRINVLGTQHIIDACLKFHKKVIYVSTDFVFDGEKPQGEFYNEDDVRHPINWYACTKAEGEKIISQSEAAFLILRLAFPYRSNFAKNDFVRVIKARLENKQPVAAVVDQILCPTFIDDFAKALDVFFKSQEAGIFHCVGDSALTPYDAAMIISKEFDLDESLISKTTRAEFFKNRAPRPFNLALKNDKIEKLGIKMRGFEESLLEMKKQTKQFSI